MLSVEEIEEIEMHRRAVKVVRLFIDGKVRIFENGFIYVLIFCDILKEKDVVIRGDAVALYGLGKIINRDVAFVARGLVNSLEYGSVTQILCLRSESSYLPCSL